MLKKKSTLKKPADLTNKLSMLLHKTNEHFGDHDTEFEEATMCSTKIFEIQCAWHTTSAIRKLRFSSCPGAKVRHQGPQDIARAQPWVGDV